MSLTGPAFLTLVIMLTAASLLGAVIVLPRLSAWRPAPVLARTGLVLSTNVVVLFAAAVVLNDQYLFYADWTDLRTSVFGGATSSTSHAGASTPAAANGPVPATSGLPKVLPTLPPGAGTTDRVLRYTVTGTRSGLTGAVLVTLPQGYTAPENRSRRYPVLETFPGYPGNAAQWVDKLDLATVLDNAAAKHLAAPVIMISPATEIPPGVDTECVNGSPTDPAVETWLTHDVPHWALHTLRVSTRRGGWATIGFSTGAWCAAMATMLHPQQYSAGIILGGYMHPHFGRNYRPFGPGSPAWRRYDLTALARHRPPPVALWIETSHSDPLSYPSTKRLLAAARPPLSIQALILSHAGHRIGLWYDELPQVVAWLGANIAGFRPI